MPALNTARVLAEFQRLNATALTVTSNASHDRISEIKRTLFSCDTELQCCISDLMNEKITMPCYTMCFHRPHCIVKHLFQLLHWLNRRLDSSEDI